MKKRLKQLLGVLMVMLGIATNAQTQTENHVVSKTYKTASQTPLGTGDPNQVTTAIQYFDGLGRAKQSVLVQGGRGGYGNNQMPYDWTLGNSGSTPFYNMNGSTSENQIVSGTTPFGDTDLLWECVNDASNNADGGWNTDWINVDMTKAYRYTVWVKKSGNLTDGRTYHGTQRVKNLDGTVNSNPYFWQGGDLPQIDTWYLMVGYVHPSDYTGGDLGISGVYDTNGNKVIDATEFKWDSAYATTSFRSFLYYATDTATRQYFWSPLVQKIDGNEDSIDDIVTTATVYNNEEIAAKDIVTHVEYDGYGRQLKEFLPYASGFSDGRINTHAGSETLSYYENNYGDDFTGMTTNDINAFSDKILEESPLGRVFEQAAPGKDWKIGGSTVTQKSYSDGHTIRFEYLSNTLNEVRYYEVTTSFASNTYTPTLVANGFYTAGELTKTVTKDENWTSSDGTNHTTEEFKNQKGQVVLKRTYADISGTSTAHDTYYVYDNFGNLTYVIPPKVVTSDGVSTTELSELCYQYKYDQRNRLVEKKIPGKGWEYIVYDKLDRPVLTQDANQRNKSPKEWLFTKYDALGRVTYTGIHKNNNSRTSIQATLDGQTTLHETRVNGYSLGGVWTYYSNNSFPTSVDELLTIQYYDDYLVNREGAGLTETSYGVTSEANVKGLPTVSKTKVLGTTSTVSTNIIYYDHKGRAIYNFHKNPYLGVADLTESKLDFTGKVLESKTTHQKTGHADIVTIDYFEYDHQDRLISQSQKINDQLPERMVRNNFDELGQLTSKLTGNGTQKGYNNVSSNITINDDVVSKTSGSGWNAGLTTLGGFQADGYVEFSFPTLSGYRMAGLSTENTDTNYTSIKYAIYTRATNDIRIYESGINRGSQTTYEVGDIFRVERIGNKVYYKKNGETFYISEVISSGRLVGDLTIQSVPAPIKNFHIVDNSKGLQNVDYDYNVRGWLTKINDDTQNDSDLFNFSIAYNNPTSGTPLYNGNIAQTSWNSLSPNPSGGIVLDQYTYSYDALNRIKGAYGSNTTNYNLISVNYDKNGNILNLQRNGHTNESATSFGAMDILSYTYDSGNKLTKVADYGNATGFKNGANSGDDYTYDANGNMKTDQNKGVYSIGYNHLNLPTSVNISSSSSGIVQYVYDAAGTKLKKIANVYYPYSYITTEYSGNYVYENNVLQFFNHPEGYVKYDNGDFEYVYQYKDHLGNVRLTYADTDNNGTINASTEIIEESNYYPFGLKHKGYNNVISSNGNANAQNFKYNGKELDEDLGLNLYHYGFRLYDAAIARFPSIDPASDQFPHVSTYNYAENEPVGSIDLWGLQKLSVNGRERIGGSKARFYSAMAGFVFTYGHHVANAIGKEKDQSNTITATADRITNKVADDGNNFTKGVGTQANAFRHTLWSAQIAATFGTKIAKDATNAKEGIKRKDKVSIDLDEKPRNNIFDADTVADLLNNAIGFRIAEDLDTSDPLELAEAILNEFKNVGLYTVTTDKDTQEVLKIEKTKITDKSYQIAKKVLDSLDENGKDKKD